MTAVVIGLAFVVGLLGLLVVGLLRSHAELLREVHDLREGIGPRPDRLDPSRVRPGVALPRGNASPAAADLVGETPDGDAVRVAMQGNDEHVLLLFLTSGCLTCRGFWDALADRASLGLDDTIRPIAITKGTDDESLSAVTALAPADVLTIMSSQAWDDYEVPVAPYAILVAGPTGQVVGEGAALTWEQIRELMLQAIADADLGLDADLRQRVDGLRRRRGAQGQRDDRVDDVLLAAGIGPDHPSLHPEPVVPPAEAR